MGFAGDTMNTASYPRHLLGQGCTVDYLTATGNDAISDQMLAFLEGSGIGMGHVIRCDDLTVGLCMIHLHEGPLDFSAGLAASTRMRSKDSISSAPKGLAFRQIVHPA